MLHCTLQHCALVRIAEKDQVLTENNLKTAWKCLSIVINIQLEHVMKRVAEMSTGNFSKFANLNMQKCKNDNILFWLIKQVTSAEVESASIQTKCAEWTWHVCVVHLDVDWSESAESAESAPPTVNVWNSQFQNFLFPSFLEIQSDWTLSDSFNEAQGHFLIFLRQTRYH